MLLSRYQNVRQNRDIKAENGSAAVYMANTNDISSIVYTRLSGPCSKPTTFQQSEEGTDKNMVSTVLCSSRAADHRIVCIPLSVNIFVTLATKWRLGYHCKVLLETSCVTSGSRIEPWLSQVKLGVFCYIMAVQNVVHALWISLYKL
jgi:hypothetical protein